MPRWSPFEPYFWSLVDKSSDCWTWKGNIDSKGYGRVHCNGKRQRAHRVSYELSIGEIPSGMLICHHCDNRKCVRPDHLFVGTASDNSLDCTKKGRNTLINNPHLWNNGKHWKNNKKARNKLSALRKEELSTGKRIVIRGEKGRILGHRMK